MNASLLAFGLFAFGLGPMEMVIVGFVVLLLFGSRLPSVMRSLGQGITQFKEGLKDAPQENPPKEVTSSKPNP